MRSIEDDINPQPSTVNALSFGGFVELCLSIRNDFLVRQKHHYESGLGLYPLSPRSIVRFALLLSSNPVNWQKIALNHKGENR